MYITVLEAGLNEYLFDCLSEQDISQWISKLCKHIWLIALLV